MNVIYEDILSKRNGYYVHALECDTMDELEDSLFQLTDELFKKHYLSKDIKEFICSMELHVLDDSEQKKFNDFNVSNFFETNFEEFKHE